MKKERAKFDLTLLVDLVCCLIGSTAFCSVLLPAMGQEMGMGDCLLCIAVALSLIVLLSRRWWITPLLVGTLAFLGFVIIYFFQLWRVVGEYVTGFFDWCSAAYPYTLPYSENGSLFLVRLAFTLPITLLLYLYFRRFSFLPVWLALSAALLVWMYSVGAEGLLPTAAMLLIVLFVLIARTNAGSINRKLGSGEKIPSAAMQLTALALAPFVVLFAVAIGPKEDGAWQSEALIDFTEDVRDVFSFYNGGSSSGGSFDLSYSGLAPNGPALGGDIDPDNQIVMRVKTSTPVLLAAAVYDAYDGRGWYDAEYLGRFRLNSPLWRGKRREVFVLDKPAGSKTALAYTRVSKTASLDITLSVRFRSLFSSGKLEGLTMKYGDEADLYFNAQGEVFTLDFPPIGANYALKTRVFAREREDFDENMRQLLAAASSGKDREYDGIAAQCTAVSTTVEPFVYTLAEEITAGCETDYDKALAIETWLSEHCTYTLTPGDVPEGRDFVSAFLERREGYCTYYASAMTVLARIAGLPARYVTGYGLKQGDTRPQTTSYVATNATAHAWTQIYFYGVGWVDFDPVNWNFYEPAARDTPAEPEPGPEEPVTPPEWEEPELPDEPEPSAEDAASSAATPARRQVNSGRIVLIFLLVRSLLLFFRTESLYVRLRRKYPDNAARADVCYRRLLKQLSFLGLEMRPDDTISTFCERADAALHHADGQASLQDVCRPVLLSRFAQREPTDGELRQMCDFAIALERELRRTLGLRRYLLRRMILGR